MITAFSAHRSPSSCAGTTAKKYTEDHEAVSFDDSTGIGTVSITDYAQSSLGDVVFVELPTLETKVTKGGAGITFIPSCSPAGCLIL